MERKFITQPNTIPVKIKLKKTSLNSLPEIHDVYCHGIIIKKNKKLLLNQLISLKIKTDGIDFLADGIVSFCDKVIDGYEIGVEFIKTTDPFDIKMTLQLCQIKNFIKLSQNKFTDSENALIWIRLNAEYF